MTKIHYGGYVYILCNTKRTVLYTGVTSDLFNRIQRHRHHIYGNSFTAKYNCTRLVYYAAFERIESAIAEEKRIKGGSRQQKIDMITVMNPDWNDLWSQVQHW
ncbi:MAG: GIY-YIG nuclease family protein [Chitinophagaceae bacterium]|jgi:putative endonuclease